MAKNEAVLRLAEDLRREQDEMREKEEILQAGILPCLTLSVAEPEPVGSEVFCLEPEPI